MGDKDLMNMVNEGENRIKSHNSIMPSATSEFRVLRYLGE